MERVAFRITDDQMRLVREAADRFDCTMTDVVVSSLWNFFLGLGMIHEEDVEEEAKLGVQRFVIPDKEALQHILQYKMGETLTKENKKEIRKIVQQEIEKMM